MIGGGIFPRTERAGRVLEGHAPGLTAAYRALVDDYEDELEIETVLARELFGTV